MFYSTLDFLKTKHIKISCVHNTLALDADSLWIKTEKQIRRVIYVFN